MWVRGLKHIWDLPRKKSQRVAPYVGAWIETRRGVQWDQGRYVAPYVGAWIET